MKRYLSTGLVVVVVIALVAVVGAGVAVTATDLSPTGLQVNSDKTSQQDLDSELEGFADSAYFANAYTQGGATFKTTSGAVNSIAGAQWMAFRVETELSDQILERRGTPVTSKQVDAARKALTQQGVLAGMSDSAITQLARLQASLSALIQELGSVTAARTAMTKEARRSNIVLDPRYGTWDARKLGICPPSSCRRVVSVLPPEQ